MIQTRFKKNLMMIYKGFLCPGSARASGWIPRDIICMSRVSSHTIDHVANPPPSMDRMQAVAAATNVNVFIYIYITL